ncbi:hypothetical protein [Bradyrhizobium yuanmingense]|uniref:hypothetical protein n=1 Tax=Bradyrhizobium yuanmingense TaxID=108015 RepID=UPI001CD5F33E|nr:hypothetical protein [Bradyrhizobium yuanmingense]MCA1530752.1 hypothetical protein [Bradyrhizobium yuanmingense]
MLLSAFRLSERVGRSVAGECRRIPAGVNGTLHSCTDAIDERRVKHLLAAIALLAFVVHAEKAEATSLKIFPFAYDDHGPVLEYYPSTSATKTLQGRVFIAITVRERASTDLSLLLDCQKRQLSLAGPTIPTDSAGDQSSAFDGIENKHFISPNKGMYERFVIAVCDGELLGVATSAARSGWTHFIESPGRALYVAPEGTRKLGKYRAASIRLYDLGGAILPDGRHIDARDAVWVIDCEQGLGAVAYERAFARVNGRNQTITTMGDETVTHDLSAVDPGKLKFGRPVPGSSQDRFGKAACADQL